MRLLKMSAVVLAMSLSLFAAESPFSGTWKLNLAKSKMSPPLPKSDIAVVDADENGVKLTEDIIDDKGQALKISWEAKFDGKDYPVTGDPPSDSVSYQRVNANTLKEPNQERWKSCNRCHDSRLEGRQSHYCELHGSFASEARKGYRGVRQAMNESHCRCF